MNHLAIVLATIGLVVAAVVGVATCIPRALPAAEVPGVDAGIDAVSPSPFGEDAAPPEALACAPDAGADARNADAAAPRLDAHPVRRDAGCASAPTLIVISCDRRC